MALATRTHVEWDDERASHLCEGSSLSNNSLLMEWAFRVQKLASFGDFSMLECLYDPDKTMQKGMARATKIEAETGPMRPEVGSV